MSTITLTIPPALTLLVNPATLERAVELAQTTVTTAIQKNAQANMQAGFQHNSSGGLSDTLQSGFTSTTESFVGSALPYARRREYGFSGQTDVLGRYYPNDPGIAYLSHAVADHLDEYQALFEQSLTIALATEGIL